MTTPAEDGRRFPTRGRPLVAFLDGWNRTLHAPAVTLGLLATTIFWSLVLSATGPVVTVWNPVEELARHLASGHTAFTDYGAWLQKAIDGAWLTGVLGCELTAIFLSGGVLDRLARGRSVGSAAFFSACGGYAGRLFRLSAPFLVIYWFLLSRMSAFLVGQPLNAWMLAALCGVTLVHGFARVRLVVEDRRSALGAISSSLRFIRRHVWRVALLYLINFAVAAGVYELFLSAGPVAARAGWLAVMVGLLGQLFYVWVYLAWAASEIAFFQAELAHAGYSARPLPMWPDSPSAEGLRNLVQPRPLR